MERSSSISVKKNTVFLTIKIVATVVFPLITFPYANWVLLPENVGKIAFCRSIISYFVLFATLGINTYAIRECSKVMDSKERLGKTASQIFSINIITTIFSYIALAICILLIPRLYENGIILIILSTSIILTTWGADWLNTAMGDLKFITIRTIVFQVIAIGALLVCVHTPDDYLVYAVISIISSSGAYLVNVFYRRRYCSVRFTFDMDWKRRFPGIILLFGVLLAETIYTNIDTTMIGLMKNDIDVGLYSVSIKVYRLVQQVIAALLWVVLPSLTRAYSDRNYKEINKTIRYVLSYYALIGIPCCVGLFFAAPEIIYIVGGSEYLKATASMMILAFSLFFTLSGEMFIGNIILLPLGREAYFLKSCIITAVVDIIGNYFLIPIWGINGAAIATVLAGVINLIVLRFAVEPQIKLEKIGGAILSPIVGSLFIPVIVICCRQFISSLMLRAFIAIICSVVVYATVIILMKNELAVELLSSVRKLIKKK